MYATLTSKGQLTLPKEIRDRLSLDAGAILDFQIQADNTITARHVQPDARRCSDLPAAWRRVGIGDEDWSLHHHDDDAADGHGSSRVFSHAERHMASGWVMLTMQAPH